MSSAISNILFGAGWFAIGAGATAYSSESIYIGAMAVGAVQIVFGLSQIGEKSEEEIEAERVKEAQALQKTLSSKLAWGEIEATDRQRIIIESVSELAHGFDGKLADTSDEDILEHLSSRRFSVFRTLFKIIVPKSVPDYQKFQIYKLGASDQQFPHIEQKIKSQNLQSDFAFGETLLKTMYFFAYSEKVVFSKPKKLIGQVEALFGFSEAKLSKIRSRVKANIEARRAVER